MSEWKMIRLAEIAEIIDPHPSHRAPDIDDKGIPFIGIGDIDEKGNLVKTARKVSEKIFEEHSLRYNLNSNTIGFGRVATIGKVIRFKESSHKLTVSPTMAIIQPKVVEPTFLAKSLEGSLVKKQIDKLLTGSTRSSLGIELLRDLMISLPPYPIQKKIASILTSMDNSIEKTVKSITKYQAIKQGMLQDLFTRGVDIKTGKLRPTYEAAPKLYKKSELGMIPKEWDEDRLGNRALIEYGKSQKAVVSVDGLIPVYGTGGIIEYSNHFLFEGESILIGRKGTIDKPFYINGKFWAVDTTYYVNSFLGNIRWLHSALKMFDLKKLNEATGVPSINREQVYNIRFAFPKNYEQDEIVKKITAFDQKIMSEQTYLQKLQQLKSGLMNDLLSGKKKVKLTD